MFRLFFHVKQITTSEGCEIIGFPQLMSQFTRTAKLANVQVINAFASKFFGQRVFRKSRNPALRKFSNVQNHLDAGRFQFFHKGFSTRFFIADCVKRVGHAHILVCRFSLSSVQSAGEFISQWLQFQLLPARIYRSRTFAASAAASWSGPRSSPNFSASPGRAR